jgi:hypothetical protein
MGAGIALEFVLTLGLTVTLTPAPAASSALAACAGKIAASAFGFGKLSITIFSRTGSCWQVVATSNAPVARLATRQPHSQCDSSSTHGYALSVLDGRMTPPCVQRLRKA